MSQQSINTDHNEMKLLIFKQFFMKIKSPYGRCTPSSCSPQRQAGEFHFHQLNGINVIVYQNYSQLQYSQI